jgi:glycosyltransferase involved in cell wall biosynthesis
MRKMPEFNTDNRAVNILYLHEASHVSGGEKSLLLLASHLDRTLFNPIFAVPPDGMFTRELQKAGVETVPFIYPRSRSPARVWKLMALKRLRDIRLVHSNSIRTHIYAALLGKLGHIPVIWHERCMLTTERFDPDKLCIFLADRVICNSYAIAERFRSNGNLPDKVRVVYSGVDTRQFGAHIDGRPLRRELGIDADEIVIGIASRFNAVKGHEVFMEAAAGILKDQALGKRVRFLVAGGAVFEEDRSREADLRELAKRFGIQEKTVFTGFRADMPCVYAAIDIFVLASETEGAGRVIFEAMASGKPLVATSSGGTPEIVEDGVTGFLVRPKDPADMAEKITMLIKEPRRSGLMGLAGRRRVEEYFSAEQAADNIERIYMEVLKK